MPRGLLTRSIVLVMCAFASRGAAEPLTEAQRQAVVAAVAATGGELSAIKGFEADLDLPRGLSSEAIDAWRDSLWAAYRDGVIRAGNEQRLALGELPATMTQLAQEAEGGRLRIAARRLRLGDFDMPFALIRREDSGLPEAGRPMFICTHGGGQKADVDGPHAWNVNTREFQTQVQFAIRLYEPEGLYFVPRMADDRLGRWRHAHHQDQFELAIRHGILFWGVDPNRVYKLGVSQGGFASAILGVFMPDRFAGINPMAAGVGLGNPAENLRNVATYTSVGERDTMFKRAPHAIVFHRRLDELREKDPAGYANHLDVQPGRGHGIDYRPGAPWIAKRTRNPHPETIVWTSKELDGRRRDAMYWLELTGDDLKGTIAITARLNREANRVDLTAHQRAIDNDQGDPTQIEERPAEPAPLTGATVNVLLNDALLDLDRDVTVTCNGRTVFSGPVQRDANTLIRTLVRRGDPNYAYPVCVPIVLD